jgi:hypothetical protein
MARHVLDIFLSSTSEDLRDYRSTVTDALGRLGQFVVRMETFGAKPNKPLSACRDEVLQSDALIVVVGHRYGWIPPKADGGDGKKSITWWEVHWALEAKKPVYAFMIDPKTPWTAAREQDRLTSSTTENQTLEVWRAVRGLQAFRTFLENETTRALFTTPEQLALTVTTSLFPWLLENASPVRPSTPADQATAKVVPPDAPPQQAAAVTTHRLFEQVYWQEQVHVLSARELITKAAPVRVAVAAGRPRVTHPALANVAITSVALDGAAAANAADDYTTALCALIAASGGGGFEGAAPGAELLSIGVLDEHYSATNANIASGIDRAVLGGARVLCLSLGGSTRSKVVADAIADAVEAGITVIAAAGNNGSAVPVYPAALESVIAVGAVGMNGEPTPWTSYGSWVDVMAPGNDLPLPAGDNGYSVMKGTSWSCAIVSGVVALLLQIDPTLKPAAVKQLLVDTAHTSHTGARVVNAQFAAWRTVWPSGKANPHPKAAAKTARRPPKKRRP